MVQWEDSDAFMTGACADMSFGACTQVFFEGCCRLTESEMNNNNNLPFYISAQVQMRYRSQPRSSSPSCARHPHPASCLTLRWREGLPSQSTGVFLARLQHWLTAGTGD